MTTDRPMPELNLEAEHIRVTLTGKGLAALNSWYGSVMPGSGAHGFRPEELVPAALGMIADKLARQLSHAVEELVRGRLDQRKR